jgi:hypothetical protein
MNDQDLVSNALRLAFSYVASGMPLPDLCADDFFIPYAPSAELTDSERLADQIVARIFDGAPAHIGTGAKILAAIDAEREAIIALVLEHRRQSIHMAMEYRRLEADVESIRGVRPRALYERKSEALKALKAVLESIRARGNTTPEGT